MSIPQLCTTLILLSGIPLTEGIHHMASKAPRQLHRRRIDITPLLVTNRCPEKIWPGISTQSGTGPSENGFQLELGETKNQTVSEDWQGRVWGRTNCTFNDDGSGPASGRGKACISGDCNGILNCRVGVSDTTCLVYYTCAAHFANMQRVTCLYLLPSSPWTPGTGTPTMISRWLMATIYPWPSSYNLSKTLPSMTSRRI